jgi:hypothetical protein
VARRHQQPEQRPGAANAAGDRWRSDSPLELMIAIALGLAAIATATSVYLNEKQEHRATEAFHRATHRLVEANGLGVQTPRAAEPWRLNPIASSSVPMTSRRRRRATR